MQYVFPPPGHIARALADPADLAAPQVLPTFAEAQRSARRELDGRAGAVGLARLCCWGPSRAVRLYLFDRRGQRMLWDFSTGRGN